jgi:hypothetical protein
MTDVLTRFRDANPVLEEHLHPSLEAMWAAIDRGASAPLQLHRRRRTLVLATGPALVVVALLLLVLFVGGTGSGGLVPSEAAAAQVLRAAATASDATASRLPAARQFFFVEWRSTFFEPIRTNVNVPMTRAEFLAPKALVTVEMWEAWSATRVGETDSRVISITFPTAAARRRWEALGRPDLRPGIPGEVKIAPFAGVPLGRNRTLTLRQLVRLPQNPRALYKQLFAGSTAAEALDQVSSSLDLYPMPSRLRAAIYRALALVPGIHYSGRVRTLTGRAGEALWAPTGPPPAANRSEVIIDPHTGTLLGTRTVITDPRSEGLPVGTIYSQTAVVQSTVTNTPRPPTD